MSLKNDRDKRNYHREYRLRYKQHATGRHLCDCGREAVKWIAGGWACARCVRLQKEYEIGLKGLNLSEHYAQLR
jgi:hypothetical protein